MGPRFDRNILSQEVLIRISTGTEIRPILTEVFRDLPQSFQADVGKVQFNIISVIQSSEQLHLLPATLNELELNNYKYKRVLSSGF
jgi:hypothetical protein